MIDSIVAPPLQEEMLRAQKRIAELEAACSEALEQVELLAKDPKTNWLCQTLRRAIGDQ